MKKAFTLVEMLVAIVLITLLIGVAIFSFRMQLLTIHKTKTEAINDVLKYNQIKSALESIKYYVVQEYDMLHQPIRKLDYFFSADETHALFMTNNPVYTDKVSLVELSCLNHSLIYKEELLYGNMDYLQPSFSLKNTHKLKIYNDLDKCEFYYINNQGALVRQIAKEIPKEIYLKIKKDEKDISVYSKIEEDDNQTAARTYNAIYEE
ncbi:type II secretion system protein [Sulfurimonas autotrophica]|uniref:Prepilin-type N-terminal cleavage/methylation domain-containing protein n=1 Tax=Sulfurimonas autotrophica (strain ATCC BAA-671 / DSM 16294 / JCM 11897 / OK10) TaxID=563040 RepID=E0UU11_SULAO|nr:type II secretion system protein [Sulfurimonas autotrophica]ADN08320.1 hypothetical protein Saut_0271 [Sulfurimonas autotrophica DSM 16294]